MTGSFGTYPKPIQARLRELQDAHEARPDIFIRYEYPKLLDKSRSCVAKLLNVTADAVVFVPNATTGVNTVLRNLAWSADGKDEILYFSFIYGACGKTIEYVAESQRDLVSYRKIEVSLPFSIQGLLDLFTDAVANSKSEGRRPRIAVFDTIVSMPGIRLPFEDLTQLCKDNDILSLIDGAHGIGHIPLDLKKLDPDFFTSNCHKWLFAPRGCAVLYVPTKHQHLMRSTLPTSHGFIPRGQILDRGPLPATEKSDFVTNFEFVGTIDSSPYLCIPQAIEWREEVCGGEEAIMKHNIDLAKRGGQRVAEILGTTVLDNDSHSLTECAMVNVRLPISFAKSEGMSDHYIPKEDSLKAVLWMTQTFIDEYKTFLPMLPIKDHWWVRLSAQVYLQFEDFGWTGEALKVVCARAGKGEYKKDDPAEEHAAGSDLATDNLEEATTKDI